MKDPLAGYLYCVGCGQRNIPPDIAYRTFRCLKCWQAFKAAGYITQSREPITVSSVGVRMGGRIIYHNYAMFCRKCGKKLGDQFENRRVGYALRLGSECHKCDDCWMLDKFPPS